LPMSWPNKSPKRPERSRLIKIACRRETRQAVYLTDTE